MRPTVTLRRLLIAGALPLVLILHAPAAAQLPTPTAALAATATSAAQTPEPTPDPVKIVSGGDEATSIGALLGRFGVPVGSFLVLAMIAIVVLRVPLNRQELFEQSPARYQMSPPRRFFEWLDALIVEQAPQDEPAFPAMLLSRRIEQGGCLVMLDGLDETGDEQRRGYIMDLIGRLAREYPGKQAPNRIWQPYALARCLVTNQQYWRFLDALERSGQDEEADRRRPRYWPGRRYRAGEGNHPVVGVSWEDACAFARWAEALILTPEQRAAGESIRLPTEPEWERAAAYPLQIPEDDPGASRREYPWGGPHPPSRAPVATGAREARGDGGKGQPADLTTTADGSINAGIPANIYESEIGGTSVVGIFPHGAAACGAQDLAGNVWEWCSTPYQQYPLPEGLEPESLYTSEGHRSRTYVLHVLRGGSWDSVRSNARCARRIIDHPDFVRGNGGFRLARLFSLT